MINTQEFKNKLLNAAPCLSNDAEFDYIYFFNGRIIGTNDHLHFELIGCVKLNTVYAIENTEKRNTAVRKAIFKEVKQRLEEVVS